jgi:hypothetical protein
MSRVRRTRPVFRIRQGVSLDEAFVLGFTQDGAEQCVGVLALGGPVVTEHGRVPAPDPVRFEAAQLDLAQGREDQTLKEVVRATVRKSGRQDSNLPELLYLCLSERDRTLWMSVWV